MKKFRLLVLLGLGFMVTSFASWLRAADDRVIVWDGPGGDVTASPDYDVTVRRDGRAWSVFTHQSVSRPYDKSLDHDGRYLK